MHHSSLSFASIMGMLRDEKVAITRERKKERERGQKRHEARTGKINNTGIEKPVQTEVYGGNA